MSKKVYFDPYRGLVDDGFEGCTHVIDSNCPIAPFAGRPVEILRRDVKTSDGKKVCVRTHHGLRGYIESRWIAPIQPYRCFLDIGSYVAHNGDYLEGVAAPDYVGLVVGFASDSKFTHTIGPRLYNDQLRIFIAPTGNFTPNPLLIRRTTRRIIIAEVWRRTPHKDGWTRTSAPYSGNR